MSKRIEVNDLNVYYSSFLAVEGITLSIEPRTVTAFIGPSGCGKSTFLRTLNRMHEVIPGARVEGQVLIDGDDLYGPGVDPVLVRRQVGMVFQRPNPFPTMSIRENVLAAVRGEDHSDRHHVPPFLRRNLAVNSGGLLCPPKPGLTLITSTKSMSSST